MLDYLGETEAAVAVENAIKYVVSKKMTSLSAGKMGYGTSEVGDLVAAAV